MYDDYEYLKLSSVCISIKRDWYLLLVWSEYETFRLHRYFDLKQEYIDSVHWFKFGYVLLLTKC